MKQHISIDDLNQLSYKRKERLRECIVCLESKLLSMFYKAPTNKSGYQNSCKSCVCLYQKNRRKNPELKKKHRIYAKIWARENYDPVKRYKASRKWILNNIEKAKEINNNWRKNNPEKIAHIKANRYARQKNSVGSHTLADWESLKAMLKNRCVCCLENKKLTKDHIVPLSLGGTNYIDNIQPLCANCNSKKGVKTTNYIELNCKEILERE